MPRRLPAARLDKPAAIPTDLYFIESQCAERYIKIGVTSKLSSRISNMRAHCPYELKVLKTVPGGAHLERDLHERFAGDRIRGEWFKPTADLLSYIAGLPTAEKPKVAPVDLEPWPAYERRMRAEAPAAPMF